MVTKKLDAINDYIRANIPGGCLIAVGDEAYEMHEKAPVNISVNYPIRNGVIANLDFDSPSFFIAYLQSSEFGLAYNTGEKRFANSSPQ